MTIFQARKLMPSATAAAITREWCGDEFHVRVRLLESLSSPADGNPVDSAVGRAGVVIASFVAHQLSEDLTTAFGGKDVIILK
jgi:hypothetical protein